MIDGMTEAEYEAERRVSERAAGLVQQLGLGGDEDERTFQVRALVRALAILAKVYGVAVESIVEQLATDVNQVHVKNVIEDAWHARKSEPAKA